MAGRAPLLRGCIAVHVECARPRAFGLRVLVQNTHCEASHASGARLRGLEHQPTSTAASPRSSPWFEVSAAVVRRPTGGRAGTECVLELVPQLQEAVVLRNHREVPPPRLAFCEEPAAPLPSATNPPRVTRRCHRPPARARRVLQCRGLSRLPPRRRGAPISTRRQTLLVDASRRDHLRATLWVAASRTG